MVRWRFLRWYLFSLIYCKLLSYFGCFNFRFYFIDWNNSWTCTHTIIFDKNWRFGEGNLKDLIFDVTWKEKLYCMRHTSGPIRKIYKTIAAKKKKRNLYNTKFRLIGYLLWTKQNCRRNYFDGEKFSCRLEKHKKLQCNSIERIFISFFTNFVLYTLKRKNLQ